MREKNVPVRERGRLSFKFISAPVRRRSLHGGIRGGVVIYLRVLIFELRIYMSAFFLPYDII